MQELTSQGIDRETEGLIMASTVVIKNNIPVLNKALIEAYSRGLEAVGQTAEVLMLQEIDRGVPPPNAPATIAQKGSSQTWVASGETYGAFSHELRDNGNSVVAGVMGSQDAVNRAIWNEWGTQDIPERPVLRKVVESSEARSKMTDEIKKSIQIAVRDSVIK